MNYPGAKYRASLSQLIESNTFMTQNNLTNFFNAYRLGYSAENTRS